MQDTFITNIHISKVRHLESLDITLSQSECKHLILTGKNGSGKTSLLESMRECIANAQHVLASSFLDEVNTISSDSIAQKKNGICITFSQKLNHFENLIFVYIPARRNKLIVPNAIKTVKIEEKTQIITCANQMFLSYILGLDYQLYGAKTDNNRKLEKNLTKWFDNFTKALRNIYDCPKLEIKRDTKNLAFIVEIPGREPFALNEMSDGYAAYFNIIMELLMRMEDADAVVDYEKPAIVMIDEIEAHLHVDMQKRVLPFLTQMFPNVQFVIATHSPFVMTSLEKAIVFDLEKKERLEKPSFYSYDTVIESFLDTSMYSNELKKQFARYKELCLKERTPEENNEFLEAKAELEIRAIPSTELYIAFQELEEARKAGKSGTAS